MVTMWFKKKSRAELIEDKAESIVSDMFVTKFSYEEIALIAIAVKAKTKHKIGLRQKELDLELLNVTNAKNML